MAFLHLILKMEKPFFNLSWDQQHWKNVLTLVFCQNRLACSTLIAITIIHRFMTLIRDATAVH